MPIGLTGNDFFPLRAAQLYDPNQLNSQADNAPPAMGIDQRLAQLYQPQTQMSEAYKQALMQIPQPQEPGKLRTIAAILGGLGAGAGPSHYYGGNAVGFSGNPKAALETTDLIKNAPYYRAMEQYGVRTKALGAGATLEERQNAERARTAETTLLRERQQADSEEKARANAERERLTQLLRDRQDKDAETRRMNQQVNDYKAKHPMAKIVDANGQLVAINPITHEQDWLGIETGKLDDSTKLHIQLQNQLAEIEARTKGQIKVEGIKQSGRQADIKARGTEARKTKSTPSGTPAPVATPTTTTTTTRDATGKVTGTREVVKKVGANNNVQMRGPDGKIYLVPPDKVDDAIKNHMVKVQ